MNNYEFYKSYPKTCDPKDFWGQVLRTVHGEPVSEDQIEMIVTAVADGLGLAQDDVLLDMCCGNGALTTLLFDRCRAGKGVDFSQYLIEVANENFATPERTYELVSDVTRYVWEEPDPEGYTVAMCYGAFQCLHPDSAKELLTGLRRRFTGLRCVFLGNLPDRDKLHEFYKDRTYVEGVEDDHDSRIGLWRTRETFRQLAVETGWDVAFSQMPPNFYAAAYRYDAVLTPAK